MYSIRHKNLTRISKNSKSKNKNTVIKIRNDSTCISELIHLQLKYLNLTQYSFECIVTFFKCNIINLIDKNNGRKTSKCKAFPLKSMRKCKTYINKNKQTEKNSHRFLKFSYEYGLW